MITGLDALAPTMGTFLLVFVNLSSGTQTTALAALFDCACRINLVCSCFALLLRVNNNALLCPTGVVPVFLRLALYSGAPASLVTMEGLAIQESSLLTSLLPCFVRVLG